MMLVQTGAPLLTPETFLHPPAGTGIAPDGAPAFAFQDVLEGLQAPPETMPPLSDPGGLAEAPPPEAPPPEDAPSDDVPAPHMAVPPDAALPPGPSPAAGVAASGIEPPTDALTRPEKARVHHSASRQGAGNRVAVPHETQAAGVPRVDMALPADPLPRSASSADSPDQAARSLAPGDLPAPVLRPTPDLPRGQTAPRELLQGMSVRLDGHGFPAAPPPLPAAPVDSAIFVVARDTKPRTAPDLAQQVLVDPPPARADPTPSPPATAFPAGSNLVVTLEESVKIVSDIAQNSDTRPSVDGMSPLRASVEFLHHPELPRHVATQVSAALQRAIPQPLAAGGADGGLAGPLGGVGKQAIELSLSPAELGRVRISMTPGDGAITVTVIAERPETLDLMRRHADMLAQDFRNLGFGSAEFAFGRSSGQSGGTGNPDAATSPDESPPPAPAPIALRIAADRVDIRL